MKATIRLLTLLCVMLGAGQVHAQKIRFKIEGQSDTTVNLVRYFGKGLYYADTAEIVDGYVEFDGSKNKHGILALFLPGQKLLEFIHNGEPDVYIESNTVDLMAYAKVKKSEENKIFIEYAKYISGNRRRLDQLVTERKELEEESEEYEKITDKIDQINKDVIDYQNNIIENNSEMLVAKLTLMSQDIEVPEPPKDDQGNILDSNFRFSYYRSHYWDHIDLSDDRLVRTPIFHGKLEKFMSKQMVFQHWDSVIYWAYWLCDQLDPSSDMYQYCVSWITSNYEKSKIMGMDKVFVKMADRYYCASDGSGRPKAFWMPDNKLVELCDRTEILTNLVMDAKPPNILLLDSTNRVWRDYYSLDCEYTLLYFWDPECGHCKKITPKLQTLYEKKFAERGIEIFAVGKAVGEDFEKWKTFIRKHNLQFINVAVTDSLYNVAQKDALPLLRYTTVESLNYQKTFDIYSTPKVIILDKDKKVIGKGLSISQLEDFLDRKQGQKDAEKLFPIEEEPVEEQIH